MQFNHTINNDMSVFVDLEDYLAGDSEPLTEARKPSKNIKKYEVRVKIEDTTLFTFVFAENIPRAKIIAKKIYGKDSLKRDPIEVKD